MLDDDLYIEERKKTQRMKNHKKIYLIPAIIKFGVKRLKCRQNGICEIKFAERFSAIDSPMENAACGFMLLNEYYLMSIDFLITSMLESTIEKHFDKDIFLMMESFSFSIKIKDSFPEYFIEKGRYKYQLNGNYYNVRFGPMNLNYAVIEQLYSNYSLGFDDLQIQLPNNITDIGKLHTSSQI